MTNEPPCWRAAREYIERGWAVIPLAPRKKEPATRHGLSDWTDNPEQADVWWGQGEYKGRGNPAYNVGIVCGQVSGGLVVLDIDEGGMEALRDWETAHAALPETVTALTGSGGRHLFYRASREVRPSVNGELHVDVRGDGSYVVAPPSIHPNGESYEWGISPDDMEVADADDTVYAFIEHVRPSTMAGEGGVKPLFELPGEIAKDRNNTLFKYACSLREKGLDGPSISVLVENANATRCKPPLAPFEVRKICGSVLRYEPGNERDEKGEEEGGIEKAEKLKNITSFEVCQMMVDDETISSGIKFDVLDQRPWKVASLPWDKTDEVRPITDGDLSSMYGILEYGRGIRSLQQFKTAFSQFCMIPSQRVNPIDDIIAELPVVDVEYDDECNLSSACMVDGERGITFSGNLFKLLLDADDTEYTRAAELLMLRQLVARAMHPGCKADSMIVLAGSQGIGKSTFARELALSERFFLDGMSKFDEEHKRRLIGKLVVEVSELEAFNHSDMSSIKQAITAQRDNIRMPYKEFAADYPRTCIFIGTTNEGAFLTDTTGNRRFLPIVCNQPSCNPNPMLFDGTGRMMIRQAVAETLALYRKMGDEAFMKTLVLPRSIASQAMEAQEAYTQEDDVLAAVSSWLQSLPENIVRVNVKMAMVEGMDYSKESFSKEKRYVKNDVARALSRCEGWRKEKGKNRVNGYGIAQTWARVLP